MAVRLDRLPYSVQLLQDQAGLPVFRYLDQRLLPGEVRFCDTTDWRSVVDAIKVLGVRGAPAIGVGGAAACVLALAEVGGGLEAFEAAAEEIAHARPTAVNLRWAVDRMVTFVKQQAAAGCAGAALVQEAFAFVKRMEEEDVATNRAIGLYGASLFGQGSRVLTHCNAGSLGTVRYGTALSALYVAAEQGKIERVYADETRPLGQGSRLTSWELSQVGIPVTVICDNMAASLMAQGAIDACIVGADRIAANGDTANKIGTYGVAVLAAHHGIPFYVAAPLSTFDFSLPEGSGIPIEQRASEEVLPQPIEGVQVHNPAFDITPAHLITAFITEQGIFEPDQVRNLASAD
ncbi:MAG: S-methyl-5-thioribose-1-phosphate isomerase [Coriobacteriia bacterium]|nr:S-methyl-5-thioribose-1-phosphate isomerase [Coriobacteriia bacterium]